MSTYTTQVRWIIENATEDYDTETIQQRITRACPLIFDFDFPMYVEAHRTELEKKILKHYFNKEIGYETVALWKFYLNERLNLIMPYYNELYTTTTLEFNKVWEVNITELYSGNYGITGSGSSSSSGSSSNANHTLNSDYPQSNYAGVDYGTSSTDSSGSGSTSTSGQSSSSESGNDTHTKTTQGWRYKTPAELILLYRKCIINIDEMIINDLADLFMTIY